MRYNGDHVLRLLGELPQWIETTSFITSDLCLSVRPLRTCDSHSSCYSFDSDINTESRFLTHFLLKCLQRPPESNPNTFTVEAASSPETPELILRCVRPQKTNTEQHVLFKPEKLTSIRQTRTKFRSNQNGWTGEAFEFIDKQKVEAQTVLVDEYSNT